MEWQEASELVYRKYGKHGTHSGATKNGHLFTLGSRSVFVSNGGSVTEYDPSEVSEKPKKVPEQPSGQSKALLAMIGENTTIHMAIFTPEGVTTACNPKKTVYSSQGPVRAVEGDPAQVTCKVCGWAIAKQQKLVQKS